MAATTRLVAAVGVFTLGLWPHRSGSTGHRGSRLLGAAMGMTGGFISFFRTVLGKNRKK